MVLLQKSICFNASKPGHTWDVKAFVQHEGWRCTIPGGESCGRMCHAQSTIGERWTISFTFRSKSGSLEKRMLILKICQFYPISYLMCKPENGVNEEFQQTGLWGVRVSYNKDHSPLPWKRRSCGKQACNASAMLVSWLVSITVLFLILFEFIMCNL